MLLALNVLAAACCMHSMPTEVQHAGQSCLHALSPMVAQNGLVSLQSSASSLHPPRQHLQLLLVQVFLLSTRAGGAGLNLIGANHLVSCWLHVYGTIALHSLGGMACWLLTVPSMAGGHL